MTAPNLTPRLRNPGTATAGRASSRPLMWAFGVVAFGGSYVLAFLLRFDFQVPSFWLEYLRSSLLLAVVAKTAAFYALGVFRISWQYVSIRDTIAILRATILGSAAVATVNLLTLPTAPMLRSVLILDGLLTFTTVGGLYAVARASREFKRRPRGSSSGLEPVFIVGAGDAGDSLLRDLLRAPFGQVRPVAFLDDDPRKIGSIHRGVPVLGPVAKAGALAERYGVRRAFIAIPSLTGPALRPVVNRLMEANLGIKILPPVAKLVGTNLAPQLRDIALEDLLRRPPARIETTTVAELLHQKVVLVTGAAGSIGSEICRQVLRFDPARLVALDCAESPLHDLGLELGSMVDERRLTLELVDIRDGNDVTRVFREFSPAVVFHAAALKHVPLLEAHPHRAIHVNVEGTRVVAEAARGVAESFVLISTDKAVRPTSVMGTSKRLAELMARQMNQGSHGTRFVSVRFGNVLGSNGSVVPIFQRQLARGGPLTVTHPEMCRYFMTIPEAVQLVLQAATLGLGGETFVLDMGQPVKIVDLAEDMIRLSGLRPGTDVRVEFTGLRPGEKLFEELVADSETPEPSMHPQIAVLRPGTETVSWEALSSLERRARTGASGDEIRRLLRDLVPEYAPAERQRAVTP